MPRGEIGQRLPGPAAGVEDAQRGLAAGGAARLYQARDHPGDAGRRRVEAALRLCGQSHLVSPFVPFVLMGCAPSGGSVSSPDPTATERSSRSASASGWQRQAWMPADCSGAISPRASPRRQSHPAQLRCRGRGLRRSRKRWCRAGPSSSLGGEQEERVALERVLGHAGVDEGVPAPAHREAGDLRRPRAERLVGDLAAVEAARERRPVPAGEQVGGLRRPLEEGGPDRLEGALGADHREEPESLRVGVAREGVGRGREAPGRDRMQVVRVDGGVGRRHGCAPFVLTGGRAGRTPRVRRASRGGRGP